MKNKYMIIVIISLLSLLIVLLFCFKLKKNKIINENSKLIDNSKDVIINNDEVEEVSQDDEVEEKCNKNELVFRSNSTISKDYSSLIKKVSFKTYKKYYCYLDECSDIEKNLLPYYKLNNVDSTITDNFSDYVSEIKDNKVIISILDNDMNETSRELNIENPVSIISHFDTNDMAHTYTLNKNGDLYYDEELIYSNVKEFNVFDSSLYLSTIIPSEYPKIVVIIKTNDNKTIIGFDNAYINIKKIDYSLINIDGYGIIITSSTDRYDYEKIDDKEIIAKRIFVSDNILYILTKDDELLESSLSNEYCSITYRKHKDYNVKYISYNNYSKKVTIRYSNNEKEVFNYQYKMEM